MIQLSRLGGQEFVLNCELIRWIESAPDTLITLSDGEKIRVMESIEQVVERTIEYKRRCKEQES